MKRVLSFMLSVMLVFGYISLPAYAEEGDIFYEEYVPVNEETVVGVATSDVFKGDGYTVRFNVTDSWSGGYNALISIENASDTAIENWMLSFEFSNKITNIWNAEISASDTGRYLVRNVGWNQDIKVGDAIEFGISCEEDFRVAPCNYSLVGTMQTNEEKDYSVKYSVESEWDGGFNASMIITNNVETTIEDWVLEFDFERDIVEIWNAEIVSHEGNHYIVKNLGYNSNIANDNSVSIGFNGKNGLYEYEPYNYILSSYGSTKSEMDITIDTDGDGAYDYIEKYFGTDIYLSDTDGDGLSDFDELYSLVLNPNDKDTNSNGINDGEEDTDNDGLINIIEVTIGSSIVKIDTDNDGLTDFEEYEVYHTDINNADTDGDGATDYEEIKNGTDPLVFDSIFKIRKVSDDMDTVKVYTDICIMGEQVGSLSVSKVDNDFLFPNTMPGYIGDAYEFKVDGQFEKASISFEFDKNLLNDSSFDPVIYYYNEDEQKLEELDTIIDGNVATAYVEHFSKYILLNRKVYKDSFEWQDVWSTEGFKNVEIVLVIDDSGSMTTSDARGERLKVARNLIDKLPDNSKVGIVRFASSVTKLTPKLTSDKSIAKSYLSTTYFKSSGSTYMYGGIESAYSLFDSEDEETLKMIAIISDGASNDKNKHDSVIKSANSKCVKIYTIGLGSSTSYFNSYLKPLANNTGGEFYLASNADKLLEIYKDINKRIDIETDSDSDGIADYYEEHMVMFNGTTLKLDKNNPDSDGDGILDGQEIARLNYEYNADRSKVIVTGKIVSNPLEEDSDQDGIADEEEGIIGTNPINRDTDGDGLDDGFEAIEGYDPLCGDPDGDGRSDFLEYIEGTDPYLYDKEWYDYTWEFLCGLVAGDFIQETDSLATICGQLTSGFVPFVDARDIVANLAYRDYAFAGLSAAGLIFDASNVVKTSSKVGKVLVKSADDLPKAAGLMKYLSKNCPDIFKILGKTDDFAEFARKLSKLDKIQLTRSQAKIITEAFEKAGVSEYLIKTSTNLKIDSVVDVGGEIWEKGWIQRGNEIEDALRAGREYLGHNFPIIDFYDEALGAVVSTKSIDIAANSYQDVSRLNNRLNKCAERLMGITESRFFKDGDIMEWGGKKVSKKQCSRKILEVVLPDTFITENTLKVLSDFKTQWADKGIEVIYKLAK